MTTPADTARRFVTALEHGDAGTLRRLIAPDVVARFPTASGIFPARFDGAGPLLAHLERAMSTFDTLSYRIAGQCSGLQAGGEGPRWEGRQATPAPRSPNSAAGAPSGAATTTPTPTS